MLILLFKGGWNAVMLATANGHTEIVKYLIEENASLDLQTRVYYASNYDDN